MTEEAIKKLDEDVKILQEANKEHLNHHGEIEQKITGLGELHGKAWSSEGWQDLPDAETAPAPETPEAPVAPKTPVADCPVQIAGNAKWEDFTATVAVDRSLTGSERAFLIAELNETIDWVHDTCDLRLTRKDSLQSTADIFITIKPIDGVNTVLGRALQWIYRGFFRRVRIELDSADMSNLRQNIGVLRHELLHAFGVKHAPVPSLMFASYSDIIDFGWYESKVMKYLYTK